MSDTQLVFTVFSVFIETFHNVMFLVFIWSIIRLFKAKYAPYAAFYIGANTVSQSIYNGCPVAEVQDWFFSKAGIPTLGNQFWFGIFGDGLLYWFMRIFLFIVGIFLLHYSYKTWYKAEVVANFQNLLPKKKPTT